MNPIEALNHLPFLQTIAEEDVAQLLQKDREYGGSWKSRGGVGAFMMLARKWDRLENMVRQLRSYTIKEHEDETRTAATAGPYDVFEHVRLSELERGDAESLLDTIGDLRRYLLLVEAEVRVRRPPNHVVVASPNSITASTLTSQDRPRAPSGHPLD